MVWSYLIFVIFLTPAPFSAQKCDTKNAQIAGKKLILRQNSVNRNTTEFYGDGGGSGGASWWCHHHHSFTTRVVMVVKITVI